MNRRDFLNRSALTFASSSAIARFASAAATKLPERRTIRVAFMLGRGTNVIDTAGPWEVFQDTTIDHRDPFELYTVAPEHKLVEMTGGMQIMPKFTFKDAPDPHIVVVPAQRSHPEALKWLRRVSPATDVTLSICTGAFQLAKAGLLKGLPATTHHDFFDEFAKDFPEVELRRGLRFVDSGRIATAGGLTSGIDLALHIVERYFGPEVARTTATYMEYQRHQ